MEEKFIRLADLQKFPMRRDHYDKEHGNVHFINGIETVYEYIDELPKYEIAVQSEGGVAEDTLCKALECCTMPEDGGTCPCDSCPRDHGDDECVMKNCVEALDVIRHQRATIEFLQKTLIENEQRHLEVLIKETAKAEVEAVTFFAERLKAELQTGAGVMRVSVLDVIDAHVRKMTEGENENLA